MKFLCIATFALLFSIATAQTTNSRDLNHNQILNTGSQFWCSLPGIVPPHKQIPEDTLRVLTLQMADTAGCLESGRDKKTLVRAVFYVQHFPKLHAVTCGLGYYNVKVETLVLKPCSPHKKPKQIILTGSTSNLIP